ncbi:hypothetical protein Tco_0888051 [Tanacetum coccineum]
MKDSEGGTKNESRTKKKDRKSGNPKGGRDEKHNEEAELPLPLNVETIPDEKDKEDKSTEAPEESEPSEWVTINDNHPDQPITIGENLFA